MNFTKVRGRLAEHYLSEPYSQIQALKRVSKAFSQSKLPILVLGNKNRFLSHTLKGLATVEHVGHQVNPELLMQVGRKYSFVVCLDPVLFLPVLQGINAPLVFVATPEELINNPDIAAIADYVIPHCGTKIDSAIDYIVAGGKYPS